MRMVPPQSVIPLHGTVYWPTVPTRATAPAPAAVAAPVPPSPNAQLLEELGKLGELRAQGVITDDEFATLKARVIGS
jgi:hypothetical protein